MALSVLASGAMLGILLTRNAQAAQPSPSPTPLATAGAPPTAEPAESTEPDASPSAMPQVAQVIPNLAIVEVATSSVNLRSAANQSGTLLATLGEGRRLFIIGAPTEAEGYRWYRVGTADAFPACEVACDLIGFVATPTDAEDAWIRQVTIACPSSPMSADELGRLHRLEALHCYGRTPLVVTGTVDLPLHGPMTPYRYSPEWLAAWSPEFLRGAWWLEFHAAPSSRLRAPERGQVVRVTGHFDDPGAIDCRQTVDPDFFGGQLPSDFQQPHPAWAVLTCRATFVWDGYEVIGFEDLGPCCGMLWEPEELALSASDRG